MGNTLGAMVFVVAGFALGYWAMTGKGTNFLNAVKGQQSGSSNVPWWLQPWQQSQPWWMQGQGQQQVPQQGGTTPGAPPSLGPPAPAPVQPHVVFNPYENASLAA